MAIGLSRVTVEKEALGQLGLTSDLTQEAKSTIAQAIAQAIERNNQEIESQLMRAGLRR